MALKSKTARAPQFFYQRLVLANWLLHEMGFADFEAAKNCLLESDEDERDGLTRWGRAIFYNAPARQLDDATLRDFDGNIARHWEHITRERSAGTHAPQLKYFQYLALLATEIYLDRLFRSRDSLRAALNGALAAHNTENGDSLPPYNDADLQKLAFWSATGSGKTLLMHVHVLQWLHHAARARDLGWEDAPPPLNKIILLTPNERLSVQHRHEAQLSGLPSRVLSGQDRTSTLPFGGSAAMLPIETIEISKLGEKNSENVIALDTLNGHNLLLVDEAHRGLSGSSKDVREWKKRRDDLRKDGFCFEYSATFEQVVGTPSSDIAHEYAKCIALDYSYRRFYNDGFGKDFRVFNLPAAEIGGGEDWARERYLCACLLQFALQLQAFARSGSNLRSWGFEKPLWIFVGSRVTQGLSEYEASDVIEIVRFLADFLGESAQYQAHLAALLSRQSGLYADGADPFAHAFDGLEVREASAVYRQIVRDVFNAPGGGALRLELLTRADGEIALRVGENAPFGVINVGDAAKLRDRCRNDEKLGALVRDDNALAAPIFAQLGASTCSANLLIGARKFIEGWNSYRVATMGLMNVGRGEGSQIIQLFGRGVRLRGRDGSLQRTQNFAALPANVRRDDVSALETLQVFGLKSDYMKQWQQAIETAGLPTGEVPHTEIIRTRLADFPQLMTLTLPADRSFESSGHTVTLGRRHLDGQPQKTLNVQTAKVDLYPKLQALAGASGDGAPDVETATQTFGDAQLNWIDWDRVMRILREMKTTKKLWALRLERALLREFCRDSSWYQIKAPAALFHGGAATQTFAQTRGLWQETLETLLKSHADALCKRAKIEWERDKHQLQPLDRDHDPSLIREYVITIPRVNSALKAWVSDAIAQLKNGPFDGSFGALRLLHFAPHLFTPLAVNTREGAKLQITPAPLDVNEFHFVTDLRRFVETPPAWWHEVPREIWLLRNKSASGVGFYNAGGFFPDFLLWIVQRDADGAMQKQDLIFVDPKGIRELGAFEHPKIQLFHDIKTTQQEIAAQAPFPVHLHSWLVSNTPLNSVPWRAAAGRADFHAQGIVFQDDSGYVAHILRQSLS